MQEFIKTPSGLCEVGRGKIRNYANIDAVCCAIQNGELAPMDLFTTVAAEGVTEDIQAVINCLVSITPGCASCTNMLVTQIDLQGATDGIDCVRCRLDAFEICVNNQKAMCSDFNALAARVGVNETNIAALQDGKVSCTDYATFTTNYGTWKTGIDSDVSQLKSDVTSNTNAISRRVLCTDYSTAMSSVNTSITNLCSCAGLKCTGTVKSIYNSATGTTCTPDANGNITLQVLSATLNGDVLTICL